MKAKVFLIPAIIALIMVASACLVSCDTGNDFQNSEISKEALLGKWINSESLALTYFDFYSYTDGQLVSVYRGKITEQKFQYRLFGDSMTIRWISDGNPEVHLKLTFGDDETIQIGGFSDIPENPSIKYLKREILTAQQNDTIVLGYHQIYYDGDNEFWLQVDSVYNDSRCPIGAVCKWEGNAAVALRLISSGNFDNCFSLNTTLVPKDTLISHNLQGIRVENYFKLVGVEPYPDLKTIPISQKDYKVKILLIP